MLYVENLYFLIRLAYLEMHSTRGLHPYAYVCVCTCTFMRCIKFMERSVFQYVARLYFFYFIFFRETRCKFYTWLFY